MGQPALDGGDEGRAQGLDASRRIAGQGRIENHALGLGQPQDLAPLGEPAEQCFERRPTLVEQDGHGAEGRGVEGWRGRR